MQKMMRSPSDHGSRAGARDMSFQWELIPLKKRHRVELPGVACSVLKLARISQSGTEVSLRFPSRHSGSFLPVLCRHPRETLHNSEAGHAGIHVALALKARWIPAFAGMTARGYGADGEEVRG